MFVRETLGLVGGLTTISGPVMDGRGTFAPTGTTGKVEAIESNRVYPDNASGANIRAQVADNNNTGRLVFRSEPDDEPGNRVFPITTTPRGVIINGSAPIPQNRAP